MRRLTILLGIFLILCDVNNAFASEDGGYAGAFLKMATEARPAAMGGAYMAVSDDPAGQLHNPAGLHAVTQPVFSSAYRAMKLDRKLSFISIVFPTKLHSAVGLSWIYAGYGDVELRDGSGRATGETISSNEHNFAVTFSKLFTPYLGLGAKINFFYKKHENLTSNSVGVNIGGMLYIDSLFMYGHMEDKLINDIKVGAAINNIAAKYPWDTEGSGLTATAEDKFPVKFDFGASCKAWKRRILIAGDLEKNEKQDMLLRLGGEYNYDSKYFLRTGLNDGSLTAGAGFKFIVNNLAFSLDYAFLGDRVDEGEDHLITLDIRF